ncbi:rRNA adenine N-6-methyltransferase family protein [Aureibaculum sp. 2210JD6-5]|uniref:class I SAM-dependent methyltransferase n=1 Tax=Aureibaculum sp. 2210JD6-5 TaxID=3103957 RepID=UPI002AAD8828|nr:rRNA adenine N-6-methyltransferase family protein [Aureibaculum sp. 2210JD6-5]MDY7394142.1 rRNA adenine N-6-methyltransferase family protein [Aureibaculum sp. 2210JD6-5]
MRTKKAFIKEAIKNIKTSGTVAPSSKYLIQKILKEVDFTKANIIVEYGSGNGNFTREILKKLNKDSQLICFEINEKFYEHLQTFKDSRLTVLNESCENIKAVCTSLNISNIDYFISSLPLTNIPDNVTNKILCESHAQLNKTGCFLQYQYSLTYYKKLKKIYHNVDLEFEIRNIPPAFIYKCKKM